MPVYQNPERVIERVIGNIEPITAQILDMDGEALDLTGRSFVCRVVRMPSGKAVVDNEEAEFLDEEAGQVYYVPTASEMSNAGRHAVYFIDVTDEVQRRWPYDGAKYILNIKRETEI